MRCVHFLLSTTGTQQECLNRHSLRRAGKEESMEILRTRGLEKIYKTGELVVRALDGVDIDISEGEFIAVIGSSGCGKTTLLNMLGGLDYPTTGSVMVRG